MKGIRHNITKWTVTWAVLVGLALVLGPLLAIPGSVFSAMPVLAQAPQTAQVYLGPASQALAPGETGAVDIRISNADELYGLYLSLSYCPDLLEILDPDVSDGIQIEPGDVFDGKLWYPVSNSVSDGTIAYSVKLSFNEPAGATGSRVARIAFRALVTGTCQIDINEALLIDRQGGYLPVNTDSALVHVQVGPLTPTPTATPATTPTATPVPATPTPTAAPTAVIHIMPEGISLFPQDVAQFEVHVSNVANLSGAEWHIQYDPTVIEILDENLAQPGTQVGFGPFLSPDSVIMNQVDAAAGRIHFAIAQHPAAPGATGAGILATFRVRALRQGATSLQLYSSSLVNTSAQAISHGAAGGLVAVNARVVTGKALLQGRAQYGGSQVFCDSLPRVTTMSDGSFVFVCPVPAGSTASFSVGHMGYLSATKTLVIPTQGIVPLGTVVLFAGDAVGPRTEVEREEGCPGTPSAIMPGTQDGLVDIIDLTFVASRVGLQVGDPMWLPSEDGCHPEWIGQRADINGDGVCDILDLTLLGANFGRVGPQAW